MSKEHDKWCRRYFGGECDCLPQETQRDRPAASMIFNERIRQQTEEGYTPEHDDGHTEGQLALLAAIYALSSCDHGGKLRQEIAETLEFYNWPFKPIDPIRDLVRAGALILAELERRLRAEEK